MTEHIANRRDFLAGRALRDEVMAVGKATGEAILGDGDKTRLVPTSAATIRLATSAMATDFSVIFNAIREDDPRQPLRWASEALDLIHVLEDQMSVYRPQTELSQLNRVAASRPVQVEERLFELLVQARELWRETDGCFDPTSGPLIALWRQCRKEVRLPAESELATSLAQVGMQSVVFSESAISFSRTGIELNFGSIGKGYALDRAADILLEGELDEWLIQGGHSSIVARGEHNGLPGWPVGIRNPLLPQRQLGTILLRDQALATSGTAVQHFRLNGKRYGHIIDPRSGWPADKMLSVTVLAPTAAEADALSTAFFVGGVELAERYCSNHPSVSALLIPPPTVGQRLETVNVGVPLEQLFWNDE